MIEALSGTGEDFFRREHGRGGEFTSGKKSNEDRMR